MRFEAGNVVAVFDVAKAKGKEELKETSMIGGGSIGNPGPSWHAAGTGDFNADGYSDILWQR